MAFFIYKMGAVLSNIKNTGKEARQPLLLRFSASSPTRRDSNTWKTAKAQEHPTWGGNNNTKGHEPSPDGVRATFECPVRKTLGSGGAIPTDTADTMQSTTLVSKD